MPTSTSVKIKKIFIPALAKSIRSYLNAEDANKITTELYDIMKQADERFTIPMRVVNSAILNAREVSEYFASEILVPGRILN